MKNISVFKHILHIGPNYLDHKGGMGAVISIYKKNAPYFNFISSYEGNYTTLQNIPYFFISLVKLLWLLITNRNIKIIHIHSAAYGSFYRKYLIFLLGKFMFNKKIIYHIHAPNFHLFYAESSLISKILIKNFLKHSDCIIVLSKYWLEYVKKNFEYKYLLILNNPIEIPKISIQESDIANEISSFLFLGRIGHRKGIFNLLQVLVENRDHYNKKIILKIGGDGESEKLKSFISVNKLFDMVEYIGWVDGDLKNSFLKHCDVLILPSYNEGLPIVILEAMSYGKAIIATNVGGIPEIVQDGINGYLIRPGDNIDLKAKIDLILNDKTILSTMGKNSLEKIHDYDICEVLKRIEHLYSKLLN